MKRCVRHKTWTRVIKPTTVDGKDPGNVLRAGSCFLKILMLKSRSPVSQNVTSFGNKAVADRAGEGEVVRGAPVPDDWRPA